MFVKFFICHFLKKKKLIKYGYGKFVVKEKSRNLNNNLYLFLKWKLALLFCLFFFNLILNCYENEDVTLR
jgi:hypothetical protein